MNILGGKNSHISIEVMKNYQFLDYIRGGMQINLVAGIDFTCSNGYSQYSSFLHYIGNKENIYETAIRSCGNIIAYYNYDQLFPAFRLGGIFCEEQKVNHCYPLNMNYEKQEITGNEWILQCYRTLLSQTKLLLMKIKWIILF